MNAVRLAVVLGCSWLLGACTSPERKFCQETGACRQMTAAGYVVTQGAVDDCTDANFFTQNQVDVIDQCWDEEDCAFVACICDVIKRSSASGLCA